MCVCTHRCVSVFGYVYTNAGFFYLRVAGLEIVETRGLENLSIIMHTESLIDNFRIKNIYRYHTDSQFVYLQLYIFNLLINLFNLCAYSPMYWRTKRRWTRHA